MFCFWFQIAVAIIKMWFNYKERRYLQRNKLTLGRKALGLTRIRTGETHLLLYNIQYSTSISDQVLYQTLNLFWLNLKWKHMESFWHRISGKNVRKQEWNKQQWDFDRDRDVSNTWFISALGTGSKLESVQTGRYSLFSHKGLLLWIKVRGHVICGVIGLQQWK